MLYNNDKGLLSISQLFLVVISKSIIFRLSLIVINIGIWSISEQPILKTFIPSINAAYYTSLSILQ